MENENKKTYVKGEDTPEEIQMCLHCTKPKCTNCLAKKHLFGNKS